MKATVPSLPKENGVPVKINVILLRFPQAKLSLQIVLPVKKLKHLSRKAQKVRVSGWKGIRTTTPLSPKFIVTTGTTNTPLSLKFIITFHALHGYKIRHV